MNSVHASLAGCQPEASTFLSAGCSEKWYFDWIAQTYGGRIRRHIGIEAFSPRPEGLGPEIEWLSQSSSKMEGVTDEEVDLVFAGQFIEHLWPDEVSAAPPTRRRFSALAGSLFVRANATRSAQFPHSVGKQELIDRVPVVTTALGESGFVVYGPYVPLAQGKYVAIYSLALPDGAWPGGDMRGEILCRIEVTSAAGQSIIAQRSLTLADFTGSGEFHFFHLSFDLAQPQTGVEFRVFGTGRAALAAGLKVELSNRLPR